MGRIVLGSLLTAMGMPILAMNSGGGLILLVTIPATYLLGMPAFFVLRRWGRLQWWYFASVGAMAGLICTAPFILASTSSNPKFFAAFLGYGIVHALFFWFVAIWRNDEVRLEP